MSQEPTESADSEDKQPAASTPPPDPSSRHESGGSPVQTTDPVSEIPGRSNPLDVLKPAEGYIVTPVLVWLNVGVFILMVLTGVNALHPAGEALIRWGANYTPLTLDGQPWRLFTSCFLHIGVLHLLFNMYALVQIGPVLEPLLGTRQFTIAYLTAGLLGSVVSLWWHDVVLGAGASGAIFGLYGVFLALLTTNWLDAETRRSLLRSILVFVGYNLMIGLQAGIDNAAHIGGLLAGLFFGYAFYYSALHPNRTSERTFLTIIPPIVVGGIATVVYLNTANPMADYERVMKKFGQLDERAMSVFKLPANTSAAGVAKAIDERGLPAWREAIGLLDDASKYKLPAKYQQHTKLLLQYSNLRLRSFTLIQRSLIDTTHVHDQQIEAYDRQIQQVMDQLKKQ
ncbi:rhomboid family intramembrane serine protease [Spirosoma koreense]